MELMAMTYVALQPTIRRLKSIIRRTNYISIVKKDPKSYEMALLNFKSTNQTLSLMAG
jgi:hypothetical protein